ncbi:hypothetical protein [Burkholderia vietnamiensis]|uniref:hypothetical protein n=1 Tax=Burkholderia vietnamiensis TaxID=60552 RepID=UPI00264E6E8C|nr:hypothetical protein [Burkholderia vietnamiensis]MDN8037468.1 hypothetical protein [Burkholderia vietnamiensis]
MTTTTQSGVANAAPSFDETDAADAFLSRWAAEDPATASEQLERDDDATDADESEVVEEQADETPEGDGQEQEDPQEGDEESDETQGDEDEEADESAESNVLDDEKVVKVKVDDQELEVSVKDLKRLYGQEAALTKKSQAIATQRMELEAANAKAAAQLDRLHQKAAARWEPFSKIDMLVASKQLDAEQFTALRAEAQAAYDDYRFITQEVDQFVKNANEQRQAAMKAAATEAVKVLNEKVPGGWNQKVYDDVRAYAESTGMPKHIVDGIVDPFALEMIHKAMQFDKAKAVVTKKVNKTPTKVMKTTKTVTTKDTRVDTSIKAKQRLQRSGSTDDATDLFLARWGVKK